MATISASSTPIFPPIPGKYFTGDGCRRDDDGYYWITGRVDDVINVAGHRMGTAEVESALVAHPKVSEAAVVGYPHDIKGQGIYAYVTLMAGEQPTEELRKELVQWVRTEIGPIASPDLVQFAPILPKTRSGKIMRRILRKIAEDEYGSLGDTSTLADPAVVDDLVDNRQNRKSAPSLEPADPSRSWERVARSAHLRRCARDTPGEKFVKTSPFYARVTERARVL